VSSLSKKVGQRIRAIRASRGLSQEQLAERAGVSYKFIGDVERGQGNPTVTWLDAVARGLGVSVKDLVSDEDAPAISYSSLSGRDVAAMREAKERLEGILHRFGEGGGVQYKPARRSKKSGSR
jgi:transcriptional regulator with XRE-family HTH domain